MESNHENEIILYPPDDTLTLDERVEDESVWLTQAQMAELFQATKQNISLHIRNIYKEGELEEAATVKEYLTVQKEGKRSVQRNISFYNLDVIIPLNQTVMYKDPFVFSQLVQFMDRNHFYYLVRKYDGDKYVKSYTCHHYTPLLSAIHICKDGDRISIPMK